MIPDDKRITVEAAKQTMEKFSVSLVHGRYGFDGINPNRGCAVGLFLVHALQSKDDIRQNLPGHHILNEKDVGNATGTSGNYVSGLFDGFEVPMFQASEDEDYLLGHADGKALRTLVK